MSASETGRTNAEVARALGLCVRQVQRMKKAVREDGPAGLAHGNRGSTPSHALSSETAALVVELYKGKYADFNFTQFTEKLVEVEGIAISGSSVRRVLLAAGYRSPRNPPQADEAQEQEGEESVRRSDGADRRQPS